MKCKVLQENVRTALQYVAKAIPAKPQLAILNSVLVDVQGQYIEFAATDLYVGMRSKVMGTVTEPGKLAVPGKTLVEVINSLPAGPMEMETTDTVLTITAAGVKMTIPSVSSDEYPAFPESSGEEVTLTQEQLSFLDSGLIFCTSADTTRIVLTTLLFDFQAEHLQVVATDGFRLATALYPQANSLSTPQRLLVSAKALAEVCHIAQQEKVEKLQFMVSRELKQLTCTINQTEVFLRLVEGEYPPFEKIMPQGLTFEAEWDGEEWLTQLKRALIFARESSNIIKLSFTPESVTLTATSATQGTFTGSLPIKVLKGTEATIAFNGRYLMDFVTHLKPSQVWFGMSESLKPALFRPRGADHYSYVVMPFRVNE